MNKESITLAKEFMLNNHDKFLEQAVSYCMFRDNDDGCVEALTRYENLLHDMAATDLDVEAAIRYLAITQYDNCANVFDIDKAIQLILKTNAFDAYVEYIEREYSDVIDECHTSMVENVLLRIAEISRMNDKIDS